VFGALWYAPRVMRTDRRLLTGTVTSSGVRTLNFTDPGRIKRINVRVGERVRKGQVLATQYAASADAFIAVDKAAIAYDRARLAQLRAARAANPVVSAAGQAGLSTATERLALDKARLAADRVKLASTALVAPSAGIIVGANGQPGETATSSGVRDYAAGVQHPVPAQQPEFSLVPEGPQAVARAWRGPDSRPVIALRTSATWEVVALIPEHSVSRAAAGEEGRITVPAAHVIDVTGRIDAVLPTPVPTSTGTAYQAKITVTRHTRNLPLDGMAVDVLVGS